MQKYSQNIQSWDLTIITQHEKRETNIGYPRLCQFPIESKLGVERVELSPVSMPAHEQASSVQRSTHDDILRGPDDIFPHMAESISTGGPG
jgi:hypothetical protein